MFTTETTKQNIGYIDKYRPKSLKEVVGQDRIIKEIVKRLNSKEGLRQNILLTGDSGTGKTTLGIILAQTLNCINQSTEIIGGLTHNTPCGKCKSCKAIANNENNSGFHFYDGSDLNKEKILTLKNLCNSPNLYSGKRIIFIDEMQNISSGKDSSMQAVLKLVEHDYTGQVYFIMSTMSPKKINKALADRFHMHLKLKPVSSADLITRSQYILKAEGLLEKINFETLDQNQDFMSIFLREGLPHLASSVSGSVREFIQNLETCIYRELGTVKEIEEELELMSVDTSSDILSMLIAKDPKAFDALSEIKGGLDSFFNLSFNTLNDYYIFNQTGKIRLKWQKGKYQVWASQYKDNIIQLMSVYISIFEKSAYYTNNYIMNKLITEYFESPYTVGITESTTEIKKEETLVRRRRER